MLAAMKLSRRSMLMGAGAVGATSMMKSRALLAQTGAPAGAPDAYAQPRPDLAGPVLPTWESVRDHYATPKWFNPAKVGIFIHWGVYTVPAHGSEWYPRYMYTTDVKWHTEHYGSPDKFGYKDFIPMFKGEHFDADEWVTLFKEAGARYVCPVAEHHDGFAMWDSALTPWCAGRMGPKRDVIGEMAKAIRRQGLTFACSTHRMEHHCFMYPAPGVPNDQFDPRWAGFYGPPIDEGMNGPHASAAFQEDWLARIQELVDKYQPEMLYMDNGVNPREYDPIKLRAAAWLFSRAKEQGYETTMCTKQWAYLFGNVYAAESSGGAPQWIYPGAWQCDTPIGNSWGYIDGLRVADGYQLVNQLLAIVSCGGNYMLNVSPRADGVIPDDQRASLHVMGEWLKRNGEGIYDSHAWVVPGEGPHVPQQAPQDWRGYPTAMDMPRIKRDKYPERNPTSADFRFTHKPGAVYAFGLKVPETHEVKLFTFRKGGAKIESVSLVDGGRPLKFRQTEEALVIEAPLEALAKDMPYGLKLEGSVAI
ncbi:alpha-L-fucosidase [Bryocella elongata]|uniref:alpha-L-fucosidase n=2 Tax=Bryocella elongata TaxID=863522 RepID=A0A1H6BP77_9BACT|nr:alpha-L-fucosidase [Bryocella elongata]